MGRPPTTYRKRAPGAGRKPKVSEQICTLSKDEDLGLMAAIQRLREAEKQAANDFQAARSQGDDKAIKESWTRWVQFAKSLKEIEVATPGVLAINQSTIPIEDVRTEVSRMCGVIRTRLELIPRSLPARLAHQDEPACQEVLERAISECIEGLHTSKW